MVARLRSGLFAALSFSLVAAPLLAASWTDIATSGTLTANTFCTADSTAANIVCASPNPTIDSSGRVGIGTATPNTNALLDLYATDKALLLPRLTTAARDALGTPAAGLFIYNSTTNALNVYTGSAWTALATATAAGSDTQVHYNSSGAYAGDSGFTYSATNKAVTLGGATVTTSNPVLNLSQTWNAGAVTFTGLKLNVTDTASASASLLADLQVGGSSKFSVNKSGNVSAAGTLAVTGAATLSSTLGVTGALTASSTLAVTGDATFDTNTLFVDATNNRVGVGTAAPGVLFQVDQDTATSWMIKTRAVSVDNSSGFWNDGTKNVQMVLRDGSGTQRITLDSSTGASSYINAGNLGIGDTTPDHKLDVAGNIGLDASAYVNFGDTDGSGGYGLRDSAGTVQYKNSGGLWYSYKAKYDGDIQFDQHRF